MGGDNVLNIAIASLAIAVGLVSINQIFAALRTEELRQQLKRKNNITANVLGCPSGPGSFYAASCQQVNPLATGQLCDH